MQATTNKMQSKMQSKNAVKIGYGPEKRRVQVDTFEDLLKDIVPCLAPAGCALSYLDDEGDECRVTNQREFEEALRVHDGACLELTIREEELQPTVSPWHGLGRGGKGVWRGRGHHGGGRGHGCSLGHRHPREQPSATDGTDLVQWMSERRPGKYAKLMDKYNGDVEAVRAHIGAKHNFTPELESQLAQLTEQGYPQRWRNVHLLKKLGSVDAVVDKLSQGKPGKLLQVSPEQEQQLARLAELGFPNRWRMLHLLQKKGSVEAVVVKLQKKQAQRLANQQKQAAKQAAKQHQQAEHAEDSALVAWREHHHHTSSATNDKDLVQWLSERRPGKYAKLMDKYNGDVETVRAHIGAKHNFTPELESQLAQLAEQGYPQRWRNMHLLKKLGSVDAVVDKLSQAPKQIKKLLQVSPEQERQLARLAELGFPNRWHMLHLLQKKGSVEAVLDKLSQRMENQIQREEEQVIIAAATPDPLWLLATNKPQKYAKLLNKFEGNADAVRAHITLKKKHGWGVEPEMESQLAQLTEQGYPQRWRNMHLLKKLGSVDAVVDKLSQGKPGKLLQVSPEQEQQLARLAELGFPNRWRMLHLLQKKGSVEAVAAKLQKKKAQRLANQEKQAAKQAATEKKAARKQVNEAKNAANQYQQAARAEQQAAKVEQQATKRDAQRELLSGLTGRAATLGATVNAFSEVDVDSMPQPTRRKFLKALRKAHSGLDKATKSLQKANSFLYTSSSSSSSSSDTD